MSPRNPSSIQRCSVLGCQSPAGYYWPGGPPILAESAWCEGHKLDGDVNIATGEEYIERRPHAFKIKRDLILSRSNVPAT